jgi:hypothetical protein
METAQNIDTGMRARLQTCLQTEENWPPELCPSYVILKLERESVSEP